MKITITPTEPMGKYEVRSGETGEVLASFVYHEEDHSTGLRFNTGKYAALRHLPNLGEATMRLLRIFDRTSLLDETTRLKQMLREYEALQDEKETTSDRARHRELTVGRLIHRAEIALNIQQDILNAKLILATGVHPAEFSSLGIR